MTKAHARAHQVAVRLGQECRYAKGPANIRGDMWRTWIGYCVEPGCFALVCPACGQRQRKMRGRLQWYRCWRHAR
jgi:hypothetical protein